MNADQLPIVIQCPQDAIAAVPYLLGFHPADSLVIIGVAAGGSVVALRCDLVPPADYDLLTSQLIRLLAANKVDEMVLLGYGTSGEATPPLTAVRDSVAGLVTISWCLRVHDGRWWSVACPDPSRCDPDGTPYDISATVVAAQATLMGLVARSGRAEVARLVATVEGEDRQRMLAATRRATSELLRGYRDAERLEDRGVPFLIRMLRKRDTRTDQEAARLSVFLTSVRVCGEALARAGTGPDDVGFWSDITRRARGRFAAAPASLLAYVAYLEGDGALAHLALNRAEDAVPGYPLARTLRGLLDTGIPPQRSRLRLTTGQSGAARIEVDTAGTG